MTNFSDEIDILKGWIERTDRILIGAGSGLSTSAGLRYDGPRFTEAFPDFIAKYGYGSMYAATFQKYGSPEEYWAYMSRHIMMNRYDFVDNGTYGALRKLVDGKDYFVITTNVDHCFQKNGFDKGRLFYTQGDYGLWQCSGPCCDRTWDNEQTVRRMVSEQMDMRIPTDLVPRCPLCGRPMRMNLRTDGDFVQDDGWYEAAERYNDFCDRSMETDTLFLELGVGYNTPGIIKYPFWEMASENPRSRYASVSIGSSQYPPSLRGRAVGIDADIGQVLRSLVP